MWFLDKASGEEVYISQDEFSQMIRRALYYMRQWGMDKDSADEAALDWILGLKERRRRRP